MIKYQNKIKNSTNLPLLRHSSFVSLKKMLWSCNAFHHFHPLVLWPLQTILDPLWLSENHILCRWSFFSVLFSFNFILFIIFFFCETPWWFFITWLWLELMGAGEFVQSGSGFCLMIDIVKAWVCGTRPSKPRLVVWSKKYCGRCFLCVMNRSTPWSVFGLRPVTTIMKLNTELLGFLFSFCKQIKDRL